MKITNTKSNNSLLKVQLIHATGVSNADKSKQGMQPIQIRRLLELYSIQKCRKPTHSSEACSNENKQTVLSGL